MKKLMIIILGFVSFSVHAFHSSSISALRGNNFEVGEKGRTELTFEQFDAFEFGDSFFWLDVTDPMPASSDASKATLLYGEWSVRFDLSKVAGINLPSLIKGIYINPAMEFGNSGSSTRTRLYGVSVGLNIPKFNFFDISLFIRDNLLSSGSSTQLTFVYQMDVSRFRWGAYIDLVLSDEGKDGDLVESHYHTAQQFLYNVIGKKFWLGFEYQHWNRKFGIPGGPVENNLKAMAQWYF